MFLRSLTTQAMGIWRYPLHGMFHLREQNCRNAQLVPTYRGQPANEHRYYD